MRTKRPRPESRNVYRLHGFKRIDEQSAYRMERCTPYKPMQNNDNNNTSKKSQKELNEHLHKNSKTKDLKKPSRKDLTKSYAREDHLRKLVSPTKRTEQNDKYDASEMKYWMKSLSQPFRYPEPICPVGYNPVPSVFKTTARTTTTSLTRSVAQGTATNIILFPGHGSSRIANSGSPGPGSVQYSQMDAVAFHSQGLRVGDPSVVYSLGPIGYTGSDFQPINAILQANVAPGSIAATNTALGSYVALPYDINLPYNLGTTYLADGGHHARWQLTSMGIKVVNTTPEISRGGSVITFMPTNASRLPDGAGALQKCTVFPTFFDHGPTMKPTGEGVSWIPRPNDVGFWHTIADSGIIAQSELRDVALFAALTAPAAAAQTYDIEIVYNWQLSGTFVQSISSPNPTRNEHLPGVSTALQVAQATQPSAAAMPRIHEAVTASTVYESGKKIFNMASNLVSKL